MKKWIFRETFLFRVKRHPISPSKWPVTLSKNEKSCEVYWLPCESQAIIFWSCNSPGDMEMWWNIDCISGSPQFLLKPICYLLSKIKSNKYFSPPLNSTWIRLKLNHVQSLISFFIPIPPPHCSGLSKGYFMVCGALAPLSSLFDTPPFY